MPCLAGQHAEAEGQLIQQAELQAGIRSDPQKAAAKPRNEVEDLQWQLSWGSTWQKLLS